MGQVGHGQASQSAAWRRAKLRAGFREVKVWLPMRTYAALHARRIQEHRGLSEVAAEVVERGLYGVVDASAPRTDAWP